MAFGWLKKVAQVGLPILGSVVGGPVGGLAGGALGGAIGGGVKGAVGGGLAGLAGGGLLKGAGGIGGALAGLGKNPGQLAQLGLAGLSTIQGAQKQGQANKINQQLLDQLNQQAAGQAQARTMALARLGAPPPQAPNLSGLTQSANPFARRV